MPAAPCEWGWHSYDKCIGKSGPKMPQMTWGLRIERYPASTGSSVQIQGDRDLPGERVKREQRNSSGYILNCRMATWLMAGNRCADVRAYLCQPTPRSIEE